ncbi:MAG: DUF3256 family protein [Muribaculaceae bacterium]
MKILKTIIIAVLATAAFAAIQARTIGDFFVSATGDALNAIPQNQRNEMLAYLREAGRVVPTETVYGEEATLLRATDNYVKLRMSCASQIEMLMLTHKRDTVIYMVQTVATPALDSRIMALDTKGNPLPLEKFFKEPQMKDFVHLPKGSKVKPDDVLKSVRFPLISYTINDSLLTITARQNLKDFMSTEDYAEIAPYLTDSITYCARGTRFIRMK